MLNDGRNNLKEMQDIRKYYPETLIAIWLSTSADSTVLTDADLNSFIPDQSDGYLAELGVLGQASSAPGTTSRAAASNDPYSIWMRPLVDLSELYNAQAVYLDTIEYYAYDTLKTGTEGQNDNVIAVINDSKTGNTIYALSQFFNGMMPVNWQPNFFRPNFIVNNSPMIKGITGSAYGNHNNQGDLSIGLPLPYCNKIQKEIGVVTSVESYGQLAQIVSYSATNYYQRYPVLCIATFYYGFTSAPVNSANR